MTRLRRAVWIDPTTNPEVAVMPVTYVMVPVPEELIDQVDTLVFQLKFQATAPRWDEALMLDHLSSLDAEQRSALAIVASGVRAGDPVDDIALAERLGVPASRVASLVRECNQVTISASPGDLLHVRREETNGPASDLPPHRILYMVGELADLAHGALRALERSAVQDERLA